MKPYIVDVIVIVSEQRRVEADSIEQAATSAANGEGDLISRQELEGEARYAQSAELVNGEAEEVWSSDD